MSSEILYQIVGRFDGKRVLVVGDVMLDEYIWGDARRISPEAPVPVVQMARRSHAAGGAANAAANVVQLGGRAELIGAVGKDREAEYLESVLRENSIDVSGLVADDLRPTTTKTRIMAHAQQLVRLDRESREPLSHALEERLLARCAERIAAVDACIVSDYAKGVVTTRFVGELLRLAAQSQKPVIVDPKGIDYKKYRGATVIKPNTADIEQFLRRDITDQNCWDIAARELASVIPGTALLISRGPEGMTLFEPNRLPKHIPSVARTVFDVTGAGDTVIGTLALALAANAPLEYAAQLANRAAGIAVGKLGTATVSAEELRKGLRRKRTGQSAQV